MLPLSDNRNVASVWYEKHNLGCHPRTIYLSYIIIWMRFQWWSLLSSTIVNPDLMLSRPSSFRKIAKVMMPLDSVLLRSTLPSSQGHSSTCTYWVLFKHFLMVLMKITPGIRGVKHLSKNNLDLLHFVVGRIFDLVQDAVPTSRWKWGSELGLTFIKYLHDVINSLIMCYPRPKRTGWQRKQS